VGYRDPKIRRAKIRRAQQAPVTEDACERAAQLKYGVAYWTLPEILRTRVFVDIAYATDQGVAPPTGRRFRSHQADWRRHEGWREERAWHKAQLDAERLAVIEVRKARTQRKIHARRISTRRPEHHVDEEA